VKHRRIALFIAVFVAILLVSLSAIAAQRLVLVEAFTSWSCYPCSQWNPTERQALDEMGRDTVISIKYHVWWPNPNNDAFYLWNTSEVAARVSHYGVQSVPDGFVDGIDRPDRSADIWKSTIRARYDISAPCSICMTVVPGPNDTTLSYSGTISAEEDIFGAKLYVVLISDLVTYGTAPGSWGETVFPDPFRDVSPNSTGEVITVAADSKYFFHGTLRKNASWPLGSLSAVAFLQSGTDNEILQAKVTPATESDMAFYVTNNSAAQAICHPDSGEKIYSATVTNTGQYEDTYALTLSGDFPGSWTHSIEADGFPNATDMVGITVPAGQSVIVRAHVNPNGGRGTATFAISATSDVLPECISWQTQYRLMSGVDVLLVDDDGGSGLGNYEYYYTSALHDGAPDKVVGRWDVTMGALDAPSIAQAPVVVWFTGNSPAAGTISATERSLITNYLTHGGRLFLTGQGIAADIASTSFMGQYLHASWVPTTPPRQIVGLSGDPISDGLNFSITGGDGGQNQSRQSSLAAGTDGIGQVAFDYSGGTFHAAIRSDAGAYKVVFFGFGFEAIDNAASRDSVMARVIRWLGAPTAADPEIGYVPGKFALEQNYPNPFNPSTAIRYSLPQRADVSLRVFDLLGREVAVLATGTQDAGVHEALWNAGRVASGLYFYRLDVAAGNESWHAARKLMLLK
jgi:hypothetical protein